VRDCNRENLAQNFDWLASKPQERQPQDDHFATFWTVYGPSNRALICCAYLVDTGIELRPYYSPEEIVVTKLFRGPKADERVAEAADAWRINLLLKRFQQPI
jgi:hypothetical protein